MRAHSSRLASFLVACAVLLLCAPALRAQNIVLVNGERHVVEQGYFGSEVFTYDEYFGDDADVMGGIMDLAVERQPEEHFRIETKLTKKGWTDNSCAAAASDMYDRAHAGGLLPEGWEMRQIGTLGTLTTVENAVAAEASEVINWWVNGTFEDTGFDALNPPSYAHSLTVVKSPDGNYYTVDNWTGGIKVKKVYPLDPEAKYFSEDPDETDLYNAGYKLSELDKRGRPWNTPDDPDSQPPEEPEEIESEPPPTSEPVEVEVLTSADPNDKLGLLGVGTGRFITPVETLPYLIRYENMPDASAPAQEVLIRDTLDARVLDLSTFELGEIRFGDRRVPVPPGRRAFSTRVPLGAGIEGAPLELLISAALVEATGIVTWRFTTLDRDTGELPFDPLDGFLPPNRTAPEGEGSVAFTVALRPDLPDGTVIRNQARIFFDLNEHIDTPPWINTLDTRPPQSAVTELVPTAADSVLVVRWEGADDGSGVRQYDVYLAIDDGAFFRWLNGTYATEETFVGEIGRRYAFYSIAHDATGNTEPPKTEADLATTTVVDAETPVDVPATFALAAPYPNPVAGGGALTVGFALPEPGPAALDVYDVLGRHVATLARADFAAGWHTLRWDVRGAASGLYLLRLEAAGRTETRRVTVVR